MVASTPTATTVQSFEARHPDTQELLPVYYTYEPHGPLGRLFPRTTAGRWVQVPDAYAGNARARALCGCCQEYYCWPDCPVQQRPAPAGGRIARLYAAQARAVWVARRVDLLAALAVLGGLGGGWK